MGEKVRVGAAVGCFVGAAVGCFVGAAVGCFVGAAVGFLVGCFVASRPCGAGVAFFVGAGVFLVGAGVFFVGAGVFLVGAGVFLTGAAAARAAVAFFVGALPRAAVFWGVVSRLGSSLLGAVRRLVGCFFTTVRRFVGRLFGVALPLAVCSCLRPPSLCCAAGTSICSTFSGCAAAEAASSNAWTAELPAVAAASGCLCRTAASGSAAEAAATGCICSLMSSCSEPAAAAGAACCSSASRAVSNSAACSDCPMRERAVAPRKIETTAASEAHKMSGQATGLSSQSSVLCTTQDAITVNTPTRASSIAPKARHHLRSKAYRALNLG